MEKTFLGIVISLFVLIACEPLKGTQTTIKKLTDDELYRQSILSAMSPSAEKIASNLVNIDKSNSNLIWKTINGEEYLLMLTWKNNKSYYEDALNKNQGKYNTSNYPMWVTTAPELLNRMKTEKYEDVNRRLKQLLGLPPQVTYNYFVEMWVKPADLFRPCPDNEINDKTCDLCFPEGTDSTYQAWINTNRVDRYYPCKLRDKYPWSQLGYTYDWNSENTSHIGLSEFVIDTNKNIFIKKIYSTQEYLNK